MSRTHEFELDGQRYKGELPKGAAALDLYDRAMGALVLIGIPAFMPSDSVAILTVCRQLSVAKLRPLLLQTLAGWERNGAPIAEENFAELFAERPLEPWVALINVWVACGFFHVPGPSSAGNQPTKAG